MQASHRDGDVRMHHIDPPPRFVSIFALIINYYYKILASPSPHACTALINPYLLLINSG